MSGCPPVNSVKPTPSPVSTSAMASGGLRTVLALDAAQPAPSLQTKLPPPFSMRLHVLVVLQTPCGNCLKYLVIQLISSSRVLRIAAGTASSHLMVSLLAARAAVFE